MKILNVDAYLKEGCGRCSLFQTPACKVHTWTAELNALREVLRRSALTEEVKWGSPCYTLQGKNVVMLVAFKEHVALSFFKGAALVDHDGVLESPGPNSRFGRLLKFRSMDDVTRGGAAAARLIEQAIALERSGAQVEVSASEDEPPAELAHRLNGDPLLKRAFERLTPGRRRSHALYVSGALQSETRMRRVERCIPKIMAGLGFNERE